MAQLRLVGVDADSGVFTLTLQDPMRRNALSGRMREDLLEAMKNVMGDPDCRCVVLRGAGGTFCAGGDLAELADTTAADRRLETLGGLVRLLAGGPRPVVAVVEGAAVGSGLSLVLACDVVVAASDATLVTGFTRLGLAADGGITWTLARRMGAARARAQLMTGRTVSGREAGLTGLADVVCESHELDGVVQRTASAIAQIAPQSLRSLKSLTAAEVSSLDDALTREHKRQRELMETSDFREGLAAVAEGRRPVFSGE